MAMKIPTTPPKALEHKLAALREYRDETQLFATTTRQSLEQFKLSANKSTVGAAKEPASTTLQTPKPQPRTKPASREKLSIDELRNYDALQNAALNVPQILKMVTQPLNDYCKTSTISTETVDTSTGNAIPIPTPRIGISRSQDDEYNIECIEQKFGSVSPIPTSSNRKGSISSIGSARATNFRQKFRKSHTCGSLFAKCNCNEIEVEIEPAIMPAHSYGACTLQACLHTQTPSQATSNYGSFEYASSATHTAPHTFYHSISPSSQHDSLSQSTRHTSSGVYSLSTQTSSATSMQLSRDESMSASFDLSSANTLATGNPTQADSQLTVKRSLVTSLSETHATTPTHLQIPRISSSAATVQSEKSQPASATPTSGQTVPQKLDRHSRRLFQSYSHPDTDFIFTHENKHPSRECLAQAQDHVITTRDGKVEIKHPKRGSSPNIGQYQILDVAVHPDILVKISPKHSPNIEQRRAHTTQQQKQEPTNRSAQQRRRLLQRSHEIDSGGSTSESEHSFDQRKQQALVAASRELALDLSKSSKSSQQANHLATTHTPVHKPKPFLTGARSSPLTVGQDASLSGAQKYFAESGILGPIATTPTTPTPTIGATVASSLIRKTSKILQDVHVIEQIRKTSMILRANSATNLLIKKNSTSTLQSSTSETTAAPAVENRTSNNNSTCISRNNNYANMETPATIVYAPTANATADMSMYCQNQLTQSPLHSDVRDEQIKSLQGEIVSLKDVIKSRDAEIMKLRREIHKLKSVLQQTTNHLPIAHDDVFHGPASAPTTPTRTPDTPQQCAEVTTTTVGMPQLPCSCCKCVHEDAAAAVLSTASTTNSNMESRTGQLSSDTATVTCALVANEPETTIDHASSSLACNGAKPKFINAIMAPVLKKQGVSAESCEQSMQQSFSTPIPTYDKDYSAKQLIKDAIMDNDFLKNIDASQVRELVESMYPLSIAKGEFVIREGEVGAHLYVSAGGEFEVMKNGKVLGIMGPGKAFGELAILYNCTRTASIRVLCDARVWVLDRRVFQQIMMRTGLQRIENSVNFLRSVPLLKNLSEEVLAKIADVLEVEFYPAGTYIIRQGASGDTFFLISQGSVKVTQKVTPAADEKEIRMLERGDYFGEQALINEDKRTANIIAMAPGVECLTLDRDSFTHLIGDLCELKEKNYGDENRVLAMKYAESTKEVFGANVKQEFPNLQLTDLEVVATLGIGGFGRVELVKAYQEDRVDIFALKCLKKCHILETKQEDHVFSERTIMLTCKSPFICRLYRTFRDEKYVYMLLEACMGGEIWTMLRDRGSFDENATQFIVACVLQAFEYLHARGIIYRDLKPENLMLSEHGYVKLVDFGFAKYIGNGSKTWTFCGTPEYVAPEIILNKGHDRAVDYWALGILIHELLNGTPPFTANDPMKTYNIILKGIDMITFPKHMSRSAIQLIKRLCRDLPAERLGYQKGGIQDIKKHKWFLGFDWDGIEQQLLIPPFVRPIAHPTDTTYFDQFPCDPDEPPDELSGWDEGF